MSAETSIAVIGAGFLGEALLRRWIGAGRSPSELLATHRRPERRRELGEALGIRTLEDNAAACAMADTILLAVRPQDLRPLIAQLAPGLSSRQTVVSLAAAIGLHDLRGWVGTGPALCRVLLPPTVVTGGGPYFASTDASVGDPRVARAAALFESLGSRVLWVDDRLAEALLVSAGGLPPFVGYLLDAFEQWLCERGLARDEARRVLLESLGGVAHQFAVDGAFAAGLQHAATPGGLTEAAFEALQAGDVRPHLAAALDAMLRRGEAIARAARGD